MQIVRSDKHWAGYDEYDKLRIGCKLFDQTNMGHGTMNMKRLLSFDDESIMLITKSKSLTSFRSDFISKPNTTGRLPQTPDFSENNNFILSEKYAHRETYHK